MADKRNMQGTSTNKRMRIFSTVPPLPRAGFISAAALSLVLAGCAAPEGPSAARSEPAAPASSADVQPPASEPAGTSETAGTSEGSVKTRTMVEPVPGSTELPAPADPEMLALFRADNPISLESYFEQQPKLRPLNATLVLEERGSGTGTFDLPPMAPGSSYSIHLTCNEPGEYAIQSLDAEGKELADVGSNTCNSGMRNSFEQVIWPDTVPASVTVKGPGVYWIVIYNLPVPTTGPAPR